MKLHQLKYLIATVESQFNITLAAERIFTSQPGISKQLKLLEDELELKIFERAGKQLVGLTETGQQVVDHARRVLSEIENIKRLSADSGKVVEGQFRLATTQTQAKYVLPNVLTHFHQQYPNLSIDIQHSSVEHIVQLLLEQKIEFAIASDTQKLHPDIIKIPCYHWDRTVIFPIEHPLGDLSRVSLSDIAKYPIVTYKESQQGESSLVQAMQKQKLKVNIVFTARDADVIKTYVRQGLGIGLLAEMAFSPQADKNLIGYSTKSILPRCTTWIAFNKNLLMRNYMFHFIELFAPHLSKESIQSYVDSSGRNADKSLTENSDNQSALPMHKMWHI